MFGSVGVGRDGGELVSCGVVGVIMGRLWVRRFLLGLLELVSMPELYSLADIPTFFLIFVHGFLFFGVVVRCKFWLALLSLLCFFRHPGFHLLPL